MEVCFFLNQVESKKKVFLEKQVSTRKYFQSCPHEDTAK